MDEVGVPRLLVDFQQGPHGQFPRAAPIHQVMGQNPNGGGHPEGDEQEAYRHDDLVLNDIVVPR